MKQISYIPVVTPFPHGYIDIAWDDGTYEISRKLTRFVIVGDKWVKVHE